MPPLSRSLSAAAFVLLAVGLCPAHADDAGAAEERLFEAKKEYDAEAQKFRKAVSDLIDKREDDARKAGDKKAVDAAKTQRKAFDETGELPAALPTAQKAITAARAKLDKAYSAAVEDLVKLKEDALDAALQYGKRTYVSTLRVSDVKVWNKFFEVDFKKAVVDGEVVPHSLLMHPDVKTFANATFPLNGKALAFRATVGTPKHDPTLGDPASALTFEVLGDGKSLWKSEPVTKVGTFQTCVVKVEKVKTLTLRVHCSDAHGGAHAAWFAPFVAE